MAKYKTSADKKRHAMEFDKGDFVWAVLIKERFPVGEYSKLAKRKIGPMEMIEKINLSWSLQATSKRPMCSISSILFRTREILLVRMQIQKRILSNPKGVM